MLSLLNKQTTGSYKTCYILFYLGGITMKFCKYCGAQLEDNAVCNCEKSRAAQAQAQQANAQAQPQYQQRYQTDKRKQDCYICGNYKKRTQ